LAASLSGSSSGALMVSRSPRQFLEGSYVADINRLVCLEILLHDLDCLVKDTMNQRYCIVFSALIGSYTIFYKLLLFSSKGFYIMYLKGKVERP
jgi:hypothetical protein